MTTLQTVSPLPPVSPPISPRSQQHSFMSFSSNPSSIPSARRPDAEPSNTPLEGLSRFAIVPTSFACPDSHLSMYTSHHVNGKPRSRAVARQLRLSPCSDIPPKVPHSFLFTKSGHQVTTHATLVIIDPSGRTTHLSAPEPAVSTPPPKSKASNSFPQDDEHRLVSGNASDDSSVPLLASPSLGSSVLGDTPPIGLVLPPGSVVTITNHALLCKNLIGFYC
jgi:hypothetical protein